MRRLRTAMAVLGLAVLLLASFAATPVPAQGQAALTGQVTSAEEGPMEGVVVSAKKAGSTIMVSVVSDQAGRYSFPAARLDAGQYALSIRAVGYDLDGPRSADIAPGRATTADIKLRKTRNLSAQLTSSEWLTSFPGTDDQKNLLLNCADCHTMERIAPPTHTADEFLQVFERMGGYYPGAWPLQPQRLVGDSRRPPVRADQAKSFAEYLAGINLSTGDTWSYPLKTHKRPSGKAT